MSWSANKPKKPGLYFLKLGSPDEKKDRALLVCLHPISTGGMWLQVLSAFRLTKDAGYVESYEAHSACALDEFGEACSWSKKLICDLESGNG